MAFQRSSGDPFDHLADINVTPLVDVMLVLLIIFMVTAPMLHQGVSVALPRTATTNLPDLDRGPGHPLDHARRRLLHQRDARRSRSAAGAAARLPEEPKGPHRLPEGGPRPLLRNGRRDARHPQPDGHREPRHDHGHERTEEEVTRPSSVSLRRQLPELRPSAPWTRSERSSPRNSRRTSPGPPA